MEVIKRHWEPLTHVHRENEQDEEEEEERKYREHFLKQTHFIV